MATLSSIKQQFNTRTGAASLLTENQIQTAATRREEEEEAKKNNGGFLGGIGYALEKIGLGFLSGIEGIWDYTAGGLAKLFGADDWAEQQFANDWVNYNHADEWYNPSDGWKVVGDVAGGIGTSLPAIAGVAAAGAITVASGGTLSPVAAGLISASVAGLGAAGRATKEAYDQTGELGGKEFGYGALVGILLNHLVKKSQSLQQDKHLRKQFLKVSLERLLKRGCQRCLHLFGSVLHTIQMQKMLLFKKLDMQHL